MRASRVMILGSFLVLGTNVLQANWGSTAGGSVATGNFRSFGTDQVQMQRENLVIRLYRDRAKVEVDYILHNTGPAVDVRAGFPSLGAKDSQGSHNEIEDYTISADGVPVSFVHEKGDPTPLKQLYNAKFIAMLDTTDQEPGTEDQNLILDWLASTVHFDSGQTRHIRIRYDSLYAYCSGGYSDDSDTCDDRFAYVLSTAAAWNGPIAQGDVTIIPVTVDPKLITISPGNRFQRTANGWTWSFQNLRPTLADNILVSMNNRASYIADYSRGEGKDSDIAYYGKQFGRYFYLFHDYAAHTASAKADSIAANVSDYQPDTDWRTMHAPGIGDGLMLQLTRPAHVDQVGIMPGCGKDKAAWFSHSRIKILDVSVDGGSTRTVTLPDEYISRWPADAGAYQWIDLPPHSGDTREIQLNIRAVYPGTSDQLTCISEILLRKWLPARPKVKSGVDDHELP